MWHSLTRGRYVYLEPYTDGLVHSAVFPGLWLDPAAMLALDGARVMEVLEQGLRSREHEEFVRMLADRKAGGVSGNPPV